MAQRDIKKIDKTILDNFYKLVHSQDNVRLTAASSSFKILSGMKKKRQDIFNENLNYSIDRLVAGLSSSRALARRGYGALLLQLLQNFQISTERLFNIANQKLGNIGKDASRDTLIGHFLLITIILKSENYKKGKSTDTYIEKMYKHLIQLVNTKSYFEYPVCNLLVEYRTLFHTYMLNDIPPNAFGSDSRLTVTQLLSIVLCNKKEPLRELSSMDNMGLDNFCLPLHSERLQKKPLHPIFFEVSSFIITYHPQYFTNFYSKVICPVFFKANHNELAAMGFELTSRLIESTNNLEAIQILMSEHIIRTLLLSIKNKTSLQKYSANFFNSLKDQFSKDLKSTSQDKQQIEMKQYVIIQRLTNSPGSLTFDRDSGGRFFEALLNVCRPNVLKKYLERLMVFILKKPIKDQHNLIVCACLKQIAFIACRTQLIEDHPLKLKIFEFLLLNLFFELVENDSESKSYENFSPKSLIKLQCDEPSRTNIRQALESAYHATLHHMVSTTNSIERLDIFASMIRYCDSLMKDCSLSYKYNQCLNTNTNLDELWSAYSKALASHTKFIEKHKESKQLSPITTLYYFYGLQIVEHILDCKEQLEELFHCSMDAISNDQSDGSWADVLTDQIIAILSATQCPAWINKLCDRVFGLLLPYITQASIELLCSSLKTPLDADDEDASDEEGSFSNNEKMDVDNDEGDSGKEGEDGEDDDEEIEDEDKMEEDEDEDKDIEKDDINDANEDGNDDEEDYYDDEHMFKLDNVIAKMFQLNRAGKKVVDQSFKLRCLKLIKKVMKKRKDIDTGNILD